MEVVESMSDRIILLSDGKVVADGSFTELKAGSGQASLEAIFNQLTGFQQRERIAKSFVDYVLAEGEEENKHA